MTKSRGIRKPYERWTPDEIAVLRRDYANKPAKDIAESLGRALTGVYRMANDLGLRKSDAFFASDASGRTSATNVRGVSGRFHTGQKSWNKGLHYMPGGRGAENRYRPGNISGRAAEIVLPVGSLRITKDGYLEQKFCEVPGNPNKRWRSYHRLVWERANGPVPPGHVVVFKAGRHSTDPVAITLDCVELITRVDLMKRNTVHRLPESLKQVIRVKGVLKRKIRERSECEKQD